MDPVPLKCAAAVARVQHLRERAVSAIAVSAIAVSAIAVCAIAVSAIAVCAIAVCAIAVCAIAVCAIAVLALVVDGRIARSRRCSTQHILGKRWRPTGCSRRWRATRGPMRRIAAEWWRVAWRVAWGEWGVAWRVGLEGARRGIAARKRRNEQHMPGCVFPAIIGHVAAIPLVHESRDGSKCAGRSRPRRGSVGCPVVGKADAAVVAVRGKYSLRHLLSASRGAGARSRGLHGRGNFYVRFDPFFVDINRVPTKNTSAFFMFLIFIFIPSDHPPP